MTQESALRQSADHSGHQEPRRLPLPLKLTATEMAAVITISGRRPCTPQDLLRVHSINAVVDEYRALVHPALTTGTGGK
jgi:hypothetical protein